MGAMSWPTQDELHGIRKMVSEMSGKGTEDVRVVVSPYRICPLGAHVDHQGGIVSAMTINKGILLGFVPSGDTQAWASGALRDFGEVMTASGASSIENYECGCEPLIQLYEVLLRALGVFGARFSGAGFRGCCVALVDAARATVAANFVKAEYSKLQPVLASQLSHGSAVLICEGGDCARVI